MARAAGFDGLLEAGVVVVPATAMVATDHTWIGAATIAAALLASMVQSRLRVRAVTERQQRLLVSAELAWNVGADPAPVIVAMQRGQEESLRPQSDQETPEGEAGPWYHRPRRP